MSVSNAIAGNQAATSPVQVGLIDHGIGASRPPRMHTREGAAQGLGYRHQQTRPVLPACGSCIKVRQDHVWQRLFGGVSQWLQRSTFCIGRAGLCRDYQTGSRHDE